MSSQDAPARDGIEDDEIDLLDLFARLWRAKVIIASFAALAILAGLFYILNTPPKYQADSLLQLEEKSNQLALPESLADLSGDSPRAVTEIEIIRSRMVVGRAVSRLNLDWSAEPKHAPLVGHLLATRDVPLPDWKFLTPYARPGDHIALDLLDVPPEWLGEELVLTSLGEDRFEIALPNGRVLEGVVGEPLLAEDVGLGLRIGALSGPQGRAFIIEQRPENAAIASVRDDLSVAEQGRNSGILRLTYTSGDPEMARRTLDAIAQAYLSQNAERSAAEAESSLEFIEGQLPAARTAVQEAEAALNSFQQDQQAIDLGVEGEALLTQIRSLEAELIDLDLREEELAELYTPNHPEYQRLIGNKESVEARLASLREEVRALPSTQREVLNLTRDLEIAQETFVQLRNRAQELQVLRASNIGNVRIIDTARSSGQAVAPRKSRILALSALLGLVAGIGFVLIRSYLRKGIEGSEDLEAMGLPVFGTLNHYPRAPKTTRGRKTLPLAAFETPDDLFVEGLRSLRTGLHFGMLDAQTGSVVLTSPAPNAGKSFVAANLAVVAAQAGQKVCLIDADMRRGNQRKYFDLPKTHPGLAQVLAGDVDPEAALAGTRVETLTVLPCGPYPPNPSELLMRQELPGLIKKLDAEFDLILIDAPPVLAVTDAVVLGRAGGAVIGVARYGQTHPDEMLAMVRTLGTAGVKLSGAILNDFDPSKARGRYGYGYSYAYNRRYGYKSANE